MICSSVNLLFLISVILLVFDGFYKLQSGTADGESGQYACYVRPSPTR